MLRRVCRSFLQTTEVSRGVAAAMSIASALGLAANDAVALHNSNELAVRLLPCDLHARVAPLARQVAELEVGIAQRLAETKSPVAALEPIADVRLTTWPVSKAVGSVKNQGPKLIEPVERLRR